MKRLPLHALLCALGFLLFHACQAQPNPKYAHVFKGLDGTWKGKFTVYSDTRGQQKGKRPPKELSKAYLESLPLQEDLVIDVQQIYTSTSPFMQTVKISDTYPSANGGLETVKSTGYNAVEGDKLVCIVNKPDEQVVHRGSLPNPNTIIWQRDLRKPTKIEYFYETVEENSYVIVGYGYYGEDNPKHSPKTWFYGHYTRQKE